MKSLLRSLSLWLTLAAIAWLMMRPTSPHLTSIFEGFGQLILPAVAAGLTVWAANGLRASRVVCWVFWAVTCGGWLTVVLVALGRGESRSFSDERQILQIAAA